MQQAQGKGRRQEIGRTGRPDRLVAGDFGEQLAARVQGIGLTPELIGVTLTRVGKDVGPPRRRRGLPDAHARAAVGDRGNVAQLTQVRDAESAITFYVSRVRQVGRGEHPRTQLHRVRRARSRHRQRAGYGGQRARDGQADRDEQPAPTCLARGHAHGYRQRAATASSPARVPVGSSRPCLTVSPYDGYGPACQDLAEALTQQGTYAAAARFSCRTCRAQDPWGARTVRMLRRAGALVRRVAGGLKGAVEKQAVACGSFCRFYACQACRSTTVSMAG